MKKRCWILVACCCLSFLGLLQRTLPAHAAAAGQGDDFYGSAWWSSMPAFAPGGHANLQTNLGERTDGNTYWFIGHNQGNNGNSGYNRGVIVDHSLNSGNQIVVHHWGGLAIRRSQHMFGISDSYNHIFFVGTSQGNTGNSGVNDRSIDDGDRNSGNQIID